MNYTLIYRFIGIVLLIGVVSSINQIRSDLARININLNRIAKQVGVPDTITDELKNLLLEGHRITAIKKYRILTGSGLLEAKEYVDSLRERELK